MSFRALVPLVFWFLAPTLVGAAEKSWPRLELTRVDGTVQVRHGHDVQAYSRGSALPFEIPIGAVVRVLGGAAEFRGSGAVVRAWPGDEFHYELAEDYLGVFWLRLRAEGEATRLELGVGESVAVLFPGDAIALTEPAAESHRVQVLAGTPAFLEPDREFALRAGAEWRWPRPASLDFILEGEEELRSAVGPKKSASTATSGDERPSGRPGSSSLRELAPIEPAPRR